MVSERKESNERSCWVSGRKRTVSPWVQSAHRVGTFCRNLRGERRREFDASLGCVSGRWETRVEGAQAGRLHTEQSLGLRTSTPNPRTYDTV
jgi:hypothetical protein